MEFSQRLYELRKKSNLSQKEMAKKIGVAQASINYWEKGQRTPSIEMAKKIAEYFNISFEYLMTGSERLDIKPKLKGVQIPVLGHVAAGIPINAIEDIIDTEEITEEMAKTGNYFGLQIKGDSMLPSICSGDIVIVRQQDDAENGDTVIATINGNDAVCKRLRKYSDGILLISNNSNYEPMEFSNKDITELPVKILGKVVELRRKF